MSENSSAELEMVQTFMVVRCYSDSCKTFQVHQVKKSNKWVCKICTQKQSVLKVYLKGTGKEARKYVQKLNMARGLAERDKSKDVRGSHPPCDYANTFTTQDGGKMETPAEKVDHPVVFVDSKRSRWTAFLGPDDYEDEDEDETTTNRGEFSQASKVKRKARRSLSERKPHPLSAHEQEEVCPYSSINLQAESNHDMMSSKSMYFHPNRYTKLDTPSLSKVDQADSHSRSMFDLSSAPSASPDNHKEWMSEIKKDLEQFYNSSTSSIPKVSSRWSQFMCEDETESEEEVGGEETSGTDQTTHILASKSTIAKFTLVPDM